MLQRIVPAHCRSHALWHGHRPTCSTRGFDSGAGWRPVSHKHCVKTKSDELSWLSFSILLKEILEAARCVYTRISRKQIWGYKGIQSCYSASKSLAMPTVLRQSLKRQTHNCLCRVLRCSSQERAFRNRGTETVPVMSWCREQIQFNKLPQPNLCAYYEEPKERLQKSVADFVNSECKIGEGEGFIPTSTYMGPSLRPLSQT